MQSFNLGQVAIVSKGAYGSGTTYLPLQMVTHKGGAWLCKKTATGIEPGVTADWASYWDNAANGILSVTVADAGAGKAKFTAKFTDGTVSEFEFSTTALAANSVGTAELKNNAVTGEKIKNKAIDKDKLSDSAVKAFAPAYTFGTKDKVPGSPSTEPEGSIYWVVESV